MDGKRTDDWDVPDDRGMRTAAWYLARQGLARQLLAIGIVVVIGAFLFVTFDPESIGPDLRSWWQGPILVAGFLGMLFGLAWMIRIARGPRDDPPPWRYRDR